MQGFHEQERAVLEVAGADAEGFLQGLLTNDMRRAGPESGVYAALLTPQGKFLFDMLAVRPEPERFLLDVPAAEAPALEKRLAMYKLRAAVTVRRAEELEVAVVFGAGAAPEMAGAGALYADPREAALGWRWIGAGAAAALAAAGVAPAEPAAYERLRVARAVPKAGAELVAGETFPLEADFERVGGVDFKKGCYVGQEVTARMRHKAVLKKGLRRVALAGPAPAPGTEVRTADDRPAGVLGAAAGDEALAILRLDRLEGGLVSDGAALTVLDREDGAP